MNIFESLYNCCNENTKVPFGKYKDFTDKVGTYCKQADRNPKEEFLTQVFVNIMLKDTEFCKAFLDKLKIINNKWNFEPEYIEPGHSEAEMDVFGKSESIRSLLVIENKIDSEIEMKQLNKYAKVFYDEQKRYSKYTKYIVALTKFSGLISSWNSFENCNIKDEILKGLRAETANFGDDYHCRYIYWHEVYTLLENNFTDTEMQQELLAFLKSQNLDQTWCQDIGCPYWRHEFIKAYNDFAKEKNLPKKSIPAAITSKNKPNINAIDLPGDGNYFGGARIQGARRAEVFKNYSLLQINVNGKVKDLSDYINDPAECIKQSAEMILEAYGKNSL